MNLLHENDRPGVYPDSWYAATSGPIGPFPALKDEVRTDICVIGGGYTGLSAALHLARRGFDVRLLEAQRIGFGASGRNGGQVGSGQRVEQPDLEKLMGDADARLLWDMGEDAKALVRSLIDDLKIDCNWRDGVAHVCHNRAGWQHACTEAEHLRRTYGHDKLEILGPREVEAETGSQLFRGGVIDWSAGHLHPLRFAIGLGRAAQHLGVKLHEQSEVTELDPGEQVVVRTSQGSVRARQVILACNGYLGKLSPQVARRVMPINNFIVATEPLGEIAPEILPRDIAVADSHFVVNYWRRGGDGRLLFGGGESYGYRFPRDIAALVRKPMLEIYPQLADARITYAWGGTLAITRSRLPHFHRPERNVLSASGYSGHGVALATLAGQILAETVAGTEERFDLMARLPTPAFPGGPAMRSPLLALAMTWFSLRDRLGI
ncbi:NAD(P)/FAD-dependent oxidoreductase [Fluviibacterium sp. S390]|uniref:NAD(P)/FAD-dependent oxidoreductase n=1 Tax=Fluviibacterium sp. S390 TaxID=3415139 RepID=UPI003C7C46F9